MLTKRIIFNFSLNLYSINKYHLQDEFLLSSKILKKKLLNIRLNKYVKTFVRNKKLTIMRSLFLLLSQLSQKLY